MKTVSALRRVAIAAITASLSLSVMSAAQAKGSPDRLFPHTAIYNSTQVPSAMDNRNFGNGRNNYMTWDPNPDFDIQSTWPEGSPNYHGGNGG